MFYCNPCAARNKWPQNTIMKSRGRCEICEKDAICNDVPSSALPYPPGVDAAEVERHLAAFKVADQAIDAVKGAGFDEGTDCKHCEGTGRVAGGRKVIHSRSPSGFGADWDAEGVIDAINKAPMSVQWVDSFDGHDLLVEVEGKSYAFQVSKP